MKNSLLQNLKAMKKQIGQAYTNEELTKIVNSLIDMQIKEQGSIRKKKAENDYNENEEEEGNDDTLDYHRCKHHSFLKPIAFSKHVQVFEECG